MKAFWGSILLFAALLTALLFNARYIHRSTDHLSRAAEAMADPQQRSEVLAELEAFWEANRPWIALSVKLSDLEKIDERLLSLRWAHDSKNEEAFERDRALLASTAEEFDRNESLSFESVF